MNASTSTAGDTEHLSVHDGGLGLVGRAVSAGSDTEGGSAGSAGVGSFARCSVMVGGPDEPGGLPSFTSVTARGALTAHGQVVVHLIRGREEQCAPVSCASTRRPGRNVDRYVSCNVQA